MIVLQTGSPIGDQRLLKSPFMTCLSLTQGVCDRLPQEKATKTQGRTEVIIKPSVSLTSFITMPVIVAQLSYVLTHRKLEEKAKKQRLEERAQVRHALNRADVSFH